VSLHDCLNNDDGCPGEQSKASPVLAKGRYRIYCPCFKVDCYIEIKRYATADDVYLHHRLVVSQVVRPKSGQQHKVLSLEYGKVRFDVVR
jgi:hypothetical protein